MWIANPQRKERAGRPPVIPLALAMLGLMLAVAVWALIQEPPPLQVRRMPDGSLIRLEAVTVGSRHQFVAGSRWRRWLAWIQDCLGRAPPSYSPPLSNSLIFWTSRPAASRLGSRGGTVYFDEHGCEFEGYGFIPDFDTTSPRLVEGWTAPLVPRRAHWIGLRFVDYADPLRPVPLAEFQVRNPLAGPEPVWKPEPLPATRRISDVAFTLTTLQFGLAGPGLPLRPAKQDRRGWTRAGFRVTEAGRPTTAWTPASLTLFDAAGNEESAVRTTSRREDDQTHVLFEQGLCIREPAWKLRVVFQRVGQFPAADLWTVRGVPITRRGSLPRAGVTTGRYGATAELFGIAAPGVDAPGIGVTPRVRPLVALRVSPLSTSVCLKLVRATDPRGRAIAWVPYEAGSDAWSRNYAFSLKAPKDTTKVDLTFALSRSRRVEFLVRPARWSPASRS